jgi:hypothetical protein
VIATPAMSTDCASSAARSSTCAVITKKPLRRRLSLPLKKATSSTPVLFSAVFRGHITFMIFPGRKHLCKIRQLGELINRKAAPCRGGPAASSCKFLQAARRSEFQGAQRLSGLPATDGVAWSRSPLGGVHRDPVRAPVSFPARSQSPRKRNLES